MRVYFKTENKVNDVFVLLKSQNNNKSTCLSAEKVGENEYSALIDAKSYSHIAFKADGTESMFVPLTDLSDGFYITKNKELDFYIHSSVKQGTVEYFKLPYRGELKKILVWLPQNYSDKKTYKVLYMTDAQNIFDRRQSAYGEVWSADITVESAIKRFKKNYIIVGIYNDEGNIRRFEDLMPNIGSVSNALGDNPAKPHGDEFLNFFKNTLVPFINENYSTSHIGNAVIGSSCGGLMSFYLGLECMDICSFIGSFSPAFLLFNEPVWKEYLSRKSFKEHDKLPYIFFYSGNGDDLEKDICPHMLEMENGLKKLHYPQDKISSVIDDFATHNEVYWRYYLPLAIEKWASLKEPVEEEIKENQ